VAVCIDEHDVRIAAEERHRARGVEYAEEAARSRQPAYRNSLHDPVIQAILAIFGLLITAHL
jgi:hypothetical protein